ncbi:hypothetical protein CASFOL_033883 [Castilleja foliolosa]|uniref:Protein kinase domain-containing protein n=1 Tax=Castilleja foliolosa TaxID=1961234 RepID=A0ABD3C0U5_9LAMI
MEEASNYGAATAASFISLSPENALFNKYELGKLLGCGAFAKVYHARDIATGKSVAIKVINKSRLNNNAHLMANIKREIAIMRSLRHPQHRQANRGFDLGISGLELGLEDDEPGSFLVSVLRLLLAKGFGLGLAFLFLSQALPPASSARLCRFFSSSSAKNDAVLITGGTFSP